MTRLDDAGEGFDQRLNAAVQSLEKFHQEFGQGKLDRMIGNAFRKEERRLRRELNSLVKGALKQSLTDFTGGKNKGANSLIDAVFGFIPGFARGGVLNKRTQLAHAGEAGAEAVLPLKKGADGRLGVAITGRTKAARQDEKAPIHITITAPQDGLSRAIDAGDMEAVEAALAREIDHAVDARLRQHLDAGGIRQQGGRLF